MRAAAAGDVADEFLALRTDRAEQHRARVAFERFGDLGQIDRLASRISISSAGKLVDEPAQPEAVEIGDLAWRPWARSCR